MTDTMRTAGVLVMLAQGCAVVACSGDGSVTGPTRVPARTAPTAVGPIAPSADPLITGLSGTYTLTVTAASACTELPNDLRARVYEAALAHSPHNSNLSAAYFDVFMTGPRFLEGFDSSERFGFLLAGELALFWVGSLQGQPAFVERLSDTSYFAINGTAWAAVTPSARSIAAPMEGYIEYCVMPSRTDVPVEGNFYQCAPERALVRARCASDQHQLAWDRR